MTLELCGRARAATFVVGYAPTDTQYVGKKNAVWTALEGVVKEVPEHEHLFVLMNTNGRTGRRGGGKPGSEECKVVVAYGRDTLNNDGERLVSFPADHGLALLNMFSVPPRTQFCLNSTGEALTTFSRGNETENSCGMLLCTSSRHFYLPRTTTSSQHM